MWVWAEPTPELQAVQTVALLAFQGRLWPSFQVGTVVVAAGARLRCSVFWPTVLSHSFSPNRVLLPSSSSASSVLAGLPALFTAKRKAQQLKVSVTHL